MTLKGVIHALTTHVLSYSSGSEVQTQWVRIHTGMIEKLQVFQ